MDGLSGNCDLCSEHSDELKHLNLYVNGSEGILVCLHCRIALTNCARELSSMSVRVRAQTLNTLKTVCKK